MIQDEQFSKKKQKTEFTRINVQHKLVFFLKANQQCGKYGLLMPQQHSAVYCELTVYISRHMSNRKVYHRGERVVPNKNFQNILAKT